MVKRSYLNQTILFALVVYILPVISDEKQNELIYILLWTYTHWEGWIYRDLEMGREAFTSRNCSFQNCFITANRSYFNNLLDYDVLMLNAVHFTNLPSEYSALPPIRSAVQLYVLVGFEPAAYFPLPDYLNGFFNLTWTYKLNSDIVHPYFLVKNNIGEIIGPKQFVKWLDIRDLPPTNTSIIQKLKYKRLAAVWMVSNCYSKDRMDYIFSLKDELQSEYGLQVDIFGKCGNNACRKGTNSSNYCYEIIESDYYFYLAFENSNSEDYVSKKVLHGLKHLSVPIVSGGADYNRFIPDGTYLDATKLTVKELAKEIYDIIHDPPRYYDYFRWRGYYSYHDTETNKYSYSVCTLCAFLNDKIRKLNRTVYVYDNIVNWWNVPVPHDFPSNESFLNYFSIVPPAAPQDFPPNKSFRNYFSTVTPTVNHKLEDYSTSFISKLIDYITGDDD